MDLSYTLIKHINRNRNNNLYHFDGQIYLWYCKIYIVVNYTVGIFPFSVNKCYVTGTLLAHGAAEVAFQCAQPPNDHSPGHDMILESYVKNLTLVN